MPTILNKSFGSCHLTRLLPNVNLFHLQTELYSTVIPRHYKHTMNSIVPHWHNFQMAAILKEDSQNVKICPLPNKESVHCSDS